MSCARPWGVRLSSWLAGCPLARADQRRGRGGRHLDRGSRFRVWRRRTAEVPGEVRERRGAHAGTRQPGLHLGLERGLERGTGGEGGHEGWRGRAGAVRRAVCWRCAGSVRRLGRRRAEQRWCSGSGEAARRQRVRSGGGWTRETRLAGGGSGSDGTRGSRGRPTRRRRGCPRPEHVPDNTSRRGGGGGRGSAHSLAQKRGAGGRPGPAHRGALRGEGCLQGRRR